ncbi:hypothetical protein HDU86_001485 [Geranomyces michiganensis]|nr:hypothetical protein HDU86_001485 [Geranomyces michiganensis]
MSSNAVNPSPVTASSGARRPSQYEQCQEEIRQLHVAQKKQKAQRERAPSTEAAHAGQAKKARHTTAVAAESDDSGAPVVDSVDGTRKPPVRAGAGGGGAEGTAGDEDSGVKPMDDVEELGAPIDLRDRRGILKRMMEKGHSQSLVEMFTLERSPSREETERMAQQLHLHPQEVWDFFEAMRATALAKWTREKKEAGEAVHVGTAFSSNSSNRSSHYGTTPSERASTERQANIPPSRAQAEAARRASFVQQAPRSIVMIDPYGRRPSLVLNPVIPGAQLLPGQLVYPGPAGTPGYIAAQMYYPQGTPHGEHHQQQTGQQHKRQREQHQHPRRPSTAPGASTVYQAQNQQEQHTPSPAPTTPGGQSQQSYFRQPPLVYVPQYFIPPMGYKDAAQRQQHRHSHPHHHQQQQQQQSQEPEHQRQQQQQQPRPQSQRQQQDRQPSTASRNPSFASAGGPLPTMQPHHQPSTGSSRSRSGSQVFDVSQFANSGVGGGGSNVNNNGVNGAPVPGTVSYVPTSAAGAGGTSAPVHVSHNNNKNYQHHSSSTSTATLPLSSVAPHHREYYQPRASAAAVSMGSTTTSEPVVLEHRRSAASVPTAATVAAAAAAARTRRMSAAGLVPAPATLNDKD